MKKKLVIFGNSEIAQLAHFYFSSDSDYQVAAFTVDEEFISDSEFMGLPIVPFEKVQDIYSPNEYCMFVALSYTKLNELRKLKYYESKGKGYELASYVSSKCTNFATSIGENCFILEDNTIQPFVVIADNVTLWSGNHVGHHSTINSHNFISSHVVISGGVTVAEQCFIGVNVTLRDHIIIGEKNVIGAGATILSNTDSEGVYIVKETERSRIPSSRLRKI
ncbi:transferase [Vibrio panuliri]|uniref:Transferase n=1 Tax=Vibrio panuliri TaxID=1381081 RepID=A0A1Q9HAI3_9VIBR|nr:acetyltransferase [Vibrio panuliri]OLQ86140.1 transferase [Vibrio panuliri]